MTLHWQDRTIIISLNLTKFLIHYVFDKAFLAEKALTLRVKFNHSTVSLLILELLEFFLLKDVSALQSYVQSLVLQSCERHAVFQFKFAIV